MAINFLTNAVATPYIGRPFTRDIMLGMPRRQAAKTIPILIDWAAYGASSNNQRVSVSLSLRGTSGPNPLLEAVRSLYIDNTFSDITIYAFFLDCNYTVVCPPGAIVMQPVLTLDQNVLVYAEGFVDGQIPITQMQFLNTEEAGFYIPTTFGLPPALSFMTVLTETTNVANKSFVNIPIGAAAADRLIIVGINVNQQTVSGITADGVAMTQIVNSAAVGAAISVAIFALRIPAGTVIASLAVTLAGASTTGMGLAVYRMVNQDSDTPYSSQIVNDGANNAKSVTDIYVQQASGIYIGGSTPAAAVVTGAVLDTQTIFGLIGVSSSRIQAASHSSLVTESRTVSMANARCLASAVWT